MENILTQYVVCCASNAISLSRRLLVLVLINVNIIWLVACL